MSPPGVCWRFLFGSFFAGASCRSVRSPFDAAQCLLSAGLVRVDGDDLLVVHTAACFSDCARNVLVACRTSSRDLMVTRDLFAPGFGPLFVATLDLVQYHHPHAVEVLYLFFAYKQVLLVSEFCQYSNNDVHKLHRVRSSRRFDVLLLKYFFDGLNILFLIKNAC